MNILGSVPGLIPDGKVVRLSGTMLERALTGKRVYIEPVPEKQS